MDWSPVVKKNKNVVGKKKKNVINKWKAASSLFENFLTTGPTTELYMWKRRRTVRAHSKRLEHENMMGLFYCQINFVRPTQRSRTVPVSHFSSASSERTPFPCDRKSMRGRGSLSTAPPPFTTFEIYAHIPDENCPLIFVDTRRFSNIVSKS